MNRKNLENAIWRRIPKGRREYIDGQRAIPGENKPLSSMSKSTLETVAKVYGVPGYDDSMKIEHRRSDGSRVARHRRARSNPGIPLWLIFGGLAAAGVAGYFIYQANVNPAVVGAPVVVTAAPGMNPTVTLSLANQNAVSVFPPAGSYVSSVSTSGNLGDAVSNTTVAGTSVGSGTITYNYVDTNNTSQTATIPVTVTA